MKIESPIISAGHVQAPLELEVMQGSRQVLPRDEELQILDSIGQASIEAPISRNRIRDRVFIAVLVQTVRAMRLKNIILNV